MEIKNKEISQLRVDNYLITFLDEGEALVFSTVPTEQNNGGCMLAIYQPLQDAETYPLIRDMYDMALVGDENAKTLLSFKCLQLLACRSLFPVDVDAIVEITDSIKSCYARIQSKVDKYGKPQTEDEALEELAEREAVEDRLRQFYSDVVDPTKK